MPLPAYLTIKGRRQGLISANVLSRESAGIASQPEHKDQILVQAYEHRIHVPGGASVDQRIHTPLVITKVCDTASPLLYQALCDGELLTECHLDLYQISETGQLQKYFSYELEDAVIKDIEVVSPHCKDATHEHFTQLERVHIAYQRIYWTNLVGKTSGSDSWQGRR